MARAASPARYAAAMVLVAFTALFAKPAQAQTPPCDALWCATLTVGVDADDWHGFFAQTSLGALTPNEFTYDGATVQVTALYYEPDSDLLTIEISLAPGFGNLSGSDYTLQLGELSFPLGDPGSDDLFEITTSDIDWTDGDTVTVKLFEGLDGGTLSDDATLSKIDFTFSNSNPDDPTDDSDASDIHDFLTPAFDPEITDYTAVIPARYDAIPNEGVGAVPTVAGGAVESIVNGRVFGNTDEDIPLKPGTNRLVFEVTAPDGETTKTYIVTVTRLPGLRVSFAVPESHDGSTPFTVTLKFNEDISSALANVAAAVVVTKGTKGTVTADGASKRRFLVPVTPDSSDPVRIRVRSAKHCTQSHAICAVSGKLFETELSRWVGAEDDARLRALWLTRTFGSWIKRRPGFHPDATSYHAAVGNGVEEIMLQAAPYAKGVTVAVSGPAGTYTVRNRYDGGKTAELDVPSGSTTWTVTVTSADGNETREYKMTVTRGSDGTITVPADVRLKTLTVTPVDGTGEVLSFSPSFHLDTEARTFRVRVSSDTEAVRVSVEKNSPSPGVRLMRTETHRLDSIDEDPDLAGIQFELTMDRFDLGGARANRYKSIWVIGPNATQFFNRRVYQLWITKAAVGLATAAEPLMAAFENVPSSHDGSSAFTFRMAFTEDVEITPEDMRDHAFVVSGATVTGAERVDGLKSLWELTLEPTGSGAVSILTPLERACTEAGALCTADGRSLTVAPALQVAGPVPVPAAAALTASFESVPQAHDGASAFTVRLAFSEDVEITPEDMRDHALTVSGATVTAAARVDDRKDLWELTLAPTGSGTVSILTPLERACTEAGALCTADGRSLTGGLGVQVPGPPPAPALTASFASVPAEHDGQTEFWLELAFDAAVAQGSKRHIRALLGVSGGSVTRMRRKDGRLDHWRVRIEPSSHEAVTVTLSPSPACGATGAVCTQDGRTFTSALATQIQGPPGLTVADAQVQEGPNATLAFAVRLSRAPSGTVTVGYATSDGTATAGADYTAASGTLTFAAGEISKTVSVAVLDDAHDEGSETLTLTLSNASGAHIADGTATGTINNTDHMPQAWLARFGRTVADQVVDAVGERLRGPGGAGAEVRVAGQDLSGATPDGEATREAQARIESLAQWLRGESEEDRRPLQSRTLTSRDFLTGTSFSLTGGTAQSGYGSLWGRGALTRFDGREDELTLDGEVASAMLGADWTLGRAMAGLAVAHSRGEGGYQASSHGERNRSPAVSGEVETTLTGLYPYGRYAVDERLSVWGVLGYGEGELVLTPQGQPPMEAETDLAMAAAGLRGELLRAPESGGMELAVRSDALAVHTTSEAVPGPGGMKASEASVTRLRLGLEGSRAFRSGAGAALTPSLDIGVRHDGGDAETGFGVDIGAGVAWADPGSGVKMKVDARGLLTHEASGFRERGIAGSFAWDPSPTSALGPSLTLRHSVGVSATGGVDALLNPDTARRLAANDDGDELGRRRFEAVLGYGHPVLGHRFIGTPELGLGLSDTGREVRLGWRLGLARGNERVSLDLGLEAARRESANDEREPEDRIGLRLSMGW